MKGPVACCTYPWEFCLQHNNFYYGATIEYRATLEDVLLKWLGGSSVKEKYCKAHLETERNKTLSPRVVLKDLMIENEKGIYF